MIASLDELAAALARSQSICLRKASVPLVANGIADLFLAGAGFPAAGSPPAGADGEMPSNATAGALPFRDPIAGNATLVGRIAALSQASGMLSIADRIWHDAIGNGWGTEPIAIAWPTGAQRHADGTGVELYGAVAAPLGSATPATWTVGFRDQAGELRTATAAFDGAGPVGRMVPFDLPAGVTGITRVESFEASAAQASGTLSLVLCKRLVDVPLLANTPTAQDGIALGLPAVEPAACLFPILFLGSAAATGPLTAKLDLVQGLPVTSPIRPKPAPRPVGAVLPRVTSAALTSSGAALLRAEAAPRLLGTEGLELEKRATWSRLAPAGAVPERAFDFDDLDLSGRIDWLAGLGGGGSAAEEGAEEPFLHVALTHYPADGEPVVFHYSNVDRPVGKGDGAIQLDGRILDLAYCGRRMAPGGGLARLQTTLRLANHDAELNRLFRSPEFLRARIEIRVGFRSLPPAWYRPVGPVWRIDRVAAVTPSHVELALIDATDGLFGYMREPPTKQALRDALEIRAPAEDENDDPYIAVPFGGEWVKVFVLDRERTTYYKKVDGHVISTREAHRLCLGATRNPFAVVPVTGIEVVGRRTPHLWHLASLGEDEKTRVLGVELGPDHHGFPPEAIARFFAVPVQAPGGDTWYAAILELEYTVSAGAVGPWDYSNKLANLAAQGRLWARWPHGAEGAIEPSSPPWAGQHDPASLMQHLARHCMGAGADRLLHAPSFAAARKAFGWAGETRDCGGTYQFGQDGGAVLSAIGRSWNLDLWWGDDGLLHVAPQYLPRAELAEASAGALVYDAQWDIARGTWTETVPIGAERWGLANRFRYSGVRDYVRVGWIEEFGLDRADDLVARWGRVLEVDVSWDWVASCLVYLGDHQISRRPTRGTERFTPRTVATFHAPLHALELEPGDFLRVNHYGGVQEDGGYDRRLFRVEEVGLEWSGKRVKVVLADMLAEERKRTAAFDKTSNWARLRRLAPDGKHAVTFTAGSATVRLAGPLFLEAGIKPGDLVLFDDDAADVHVNLAITDTAELASRGTVTVDAPAPVTRTTGAFTVQRTRLDPPTDAEFPGQYPLGAGHYFCACDSATGTFSDGSPGFRAEGL